MTSPAEEPNNHEIDRLIIQAKCWEPEAETLFDTIGVKSGWQCVDLGCGPVGVLSPLSQRVGVHGQVIGVDEDPRCINAAKKLVDRENHSIFLDPSPYHHIFITCVSSCGGRRISLNHPRLNPGVFQ